MILAFLTTVLHQVLCKQFIGVMLISVYTFFVLLNVAHSDTTIELEQSDSEGIARGCLGVYQCNQLLISCREG